MPDADRWDRIKAVFQAALAKPADERAAFVKQQCGDASLREEVLRLLRLHESSPEFLESPIGFAGPIPGAADRLIGQRIGDFQILRHIGDGGTGAVYEAEQDQPRRRAAVKVLRRGFATPPTMRRFEYESEVLAKLRHPGIASVYAAGTFDYGSGPQPWFAMEMIDGLPLTAYAQEQQLTKRHKIDLLIQLCEAVQHAHQQGVIHRDLKPANILVVGEAPGGAANVRSDANARLGALVKVLDFGVARVIDPDVQVTMHTAMGEIVGTLSYMSPEQLSGDPERIDARSDVYALGVIAYELLAGHLPHERVGTGVGDLVRAIERDAPRPLRESDPTLRGDLEAVIGKALEKDSTRRYQSAVELAGDLRRWLKDEPVLAQPPTVTYQLRKFAQRNRALVGGVLATFIALAAGLVLYAAEARQARREAARSQYEADKATAINNFVTNDFLMKLLAAASESNAGQPLPVEQLVDRAAENVGVMFADEPLAESAVRNEVATIYYNLSAFEKAADQFAAALAGWEKHLGPDHPDTLKAVNNLGQTLAHLRRNEEAEALYRRALEGRLRVLGEDDPYTLTSMNNLANLLRWTGRLDEAEAMFQRTLNLQRRVHGETHKHTLITMANLGLLMLERGKTEDALRLHRRVYEISCDTLGKDHVMSLMAGSRLAQTLLKCGHSNEAEQLQTDVLADAQRILGPTHLDTIHARRGLAKILEATSQPEAAAAQLTQALEGLRARPEPARNLERKIEQDLEALTEVDSTTND
jgi:serine/threonine protein kinase